MRLVVVDKRIGVTGQTRILCIAFFPGLVVGAVNFEVARQSGNGAVDFPLSRSSKIVQFLRLHAHGHRVDDVQVDAKVLVVEAEAVAVQLNHSGGNCAVKIKIPVFFKCQSLFFWEKHYVLSVADRYGFHTTQFYVVISQIQYGIGNGARC